jgi:hypothetical protein
VAGDSEYESGMPSQTTSMFAERRQPEPGGLPWLLTGGALLAGILLARVIDWRAHAHSRK